jgi:hypothetical protein
MIIHDYYLSDFVLGSSLQNRIIDLGNKKHDIIEKKSDIKLKEFDKKILKKCQNILCFLKLNSC